MAEQPSFQFSRHVNGPRPTVSTRTPWGTSQSTPFGRNHQANAASHRAADDDLTDFASSLTSGTLFVNPLLKPLDGSFGGNDSGMESSFSSVSSSSVSVASSTDELSAAELAAAVSRTRLDDVPVDEQGKPLLSFSCLIAMAVTDSPQKRRTVNEIYDWIKMKFPYYESQAGFGWKNSIRHNLSQSKHFVRQTREEGSDIASKGAYWRIRAESLDHPLEPRRHRPHDQNSLASDRARKLIIPPRRSGHQRLLPLVESDHVAASPDAMEGASMLLQFSGSSPEKADHSDRRPRGCYTPSVQANSFPFGTSATATTAATTTTTTLSFLPSPNQVAHFAPLPPSSLPPIARSLAHARQAVATNTPRLFQTEIDRAATKPRVVQTSEDDASRMRTSPDGHRSMLESSAPQESTPSLFIFSSPLSVPTAHSSTRRRLVSAMDLDEDSPVAALLSLSAAK